MPVKRRAVKRRLDPKAEAEAWETVFDTGHDFFGDLKDIGINVDRCRPADYPAIEKAWHRLGHIFLAMREPDPHRQPWVLAQFGAPHAD